MEGLKVGDCVKYAAKVPGVGRIKQLAGKEVVLDLFEPIEKVKNNHVMPLIPDEMVQTQKKLQIPAKKIIEKANVLHLSKFLEKYFDFETRYFNTEKILLSGDILFRFYIWGTGAKSVMPAGTPADFCPCREGEFTPANLFQCSNCKQVYHDHCFKQQDSMCHCQIAQNSSQKRSSIMELDLDESLPSLTQNTTPAAKDVSQAPKPTPANISASVVPTKRVKTQQNSEIRKKKILEIYDAKYPLNYSTEIEKNRVKVKKILFEVFLAAVLELIDHYHELKFDFSAEKASTIAARNDQELFDFLVQATFELESELLKLSGNLIAKDSAYLKKARFFAILFKQDKLHQFLVQYFLGWLTAKKLISINESDFSDKKKMETYESRFWDGREITEEELILKNYKGFVDLENEKNANAIASSEVDLDGQGIQVSKMASMTSLKGPEIEIKFFVPGKSCGFDPQFYKDALFSKIDETLRPGSAAELKAALKSIQLSK